MNEELMNELTVQVEENNRLHKRHTAALYICTVVLALLVAVMAFFSFHVAKIGSNMGEITQALNELDMQALNDNMQTMQEQLSKLDMQALNETLSSLSETSNNLEKASAGLKSAGEAIGNFFTRK